MRPDVIRAGRTEGKTGLFTFGNMKLPRTFAIFNVTPCTRCPSDALDMCNVNNRVCSGCGQPFQCYGLNAELGYSKHTAVPFRIRQMRWWDIVTPEEFVATLVENRCRTITHLRFSEGGDIRHIGDFRKMVGIARLLYGRSIVTSVYTARSDIDLSDRWPLVVNGSGFMVDNRVDPVCRCGHMGLANCVADCSECQMCYEHGGHRVRIAYHGNNVRGVRS